jgi:hypothetical protein
MVYSPEENWIFVHIQKTGGNSVCTALGLPKNHPHKHMSAVELRDIYGEAAWNSAFKFAFVRNPWERLVSWWSMIDWQRGHKYEQATEFGKLVLDTAETFEEFIVKFDQMPDDEFFKNDWLFRPQINMVADAQGKLLVDFVGRFERLEDDWRQVSAALGRPDLVLPHINKSPHRGYASYYSPQTRDIVARHFRRDIETFGYRFEDQIA